MHIMRAMTCDCCKNWIKQSPQTLITGWTNRGQLALVAEAGVGGLETAQVAACVVLAEQFSLCLNKIPHTRAVLHDWLIILWS